MDSPQLSHHPTIGKWITILIWIIGIALLLARNWLSTVFNLNTELFMVSILGPLWSLMLVCLLAGLLRMFRKPAEKWSHFWRVMFVSVATLVLAVPQVDLIMALREGGHFPQSVDTIRLVVIAATAFVFFLVPAAIVVISWLRHNISISSVRALGLALVVHGLIYVPFGLWVNEMIIKYSQP